MNDNVYWLVSLEPTFGRLLQPQRVQIQVEIQERRTSYLVDEDEAAFPGGKKFPVSRVTRDSQGGKRKCNSRRFSEPSKELLILLGGVGQVRNGRQGDPLF